MEKEIKNLLEDEITTEFKKLSSMDPGSPEHSTAVESLTKLYKLNIEETANEQALTAKHEQDDVQLKEQKKDRYLRLGIEAAGLILPLLFYGIWMRRGFEFEKEGTYTSTTFRGLFNRFKPTKR